MGPDAGWKAGGSHDWLPHIGETIVTADVLEHRPGAWRIVSEGHSGRFFLARLSKMPSVERYYCDGVEKKEARS
jgi:hypothetical protein